MANLTRVARTLRRPRPNRAVTALVTALVLAAQLPLADSVRAEVTGSFTAKLTGSHEVPAVGSSGMGTARVVLSGTTVFYQLFLSGIGPVTAAEIDLGAIGANGPVAFPLSVGADGTVSGILSAANVDPAAGLAFDAVLDAVATGATYVNVRTLAFPGGELRGQLDSAVDVPSYAITAGAPPAGAPALDDFFPRTLTVAAGSVVHLIAYGNHTATLLPTGIAAVDDTGAPGSDQPQGCGDDASPCFFDGTTALSVGPAAEGAPVSVAVSVNAALGDYVFHSRLQPAMAGILRVVPPGSFDISSVDDIALAITAQLGAPVPVPTSVYSSLLGFDVSYPDCRRLTEIPDPNPTGFAVVGVNGGRMFRYNPCLAALWAWAGEHSVRSLYINTNAAAGPTTAQGATGPAGTCRKNDKVCYGYNYGYNGARAAWRYAYHQLGPASLPSIWWLDVEITNTWYTAPNLAANAAVIRGALDFLGAPGRYGAPSMNYQVGIYSTNYQFRRIAGSTFKPGVPVWYATVEKTALPSLSRCTTAAANDWSFTGGPVWLVQYLPGGTDHNVGCP